MTSWQNHIEVCWQNILLNQINYLPHLLSLSCPPPTTNWWPFPSLSILWLRYLGGHVFWSMPCKLSKLRGTCEVVPLWPSLGQQHRNVKQSTNELSIWIQTDSNGFSIAQFHATRAWETESSYEETATKEHEVLQDPVDRRKRSGEVDTGGPGVWGSIPSWKQTAHTRWVHCIAHTAVSVPVYT